MPATSRSGTRALIVSGKGGTGKTTVAAALAVAAAGRGHRTLLLELEGRPGAPRLLGLGAPAFEERPTDLGFSIASVGPREALLEYLRRFYGVARIARPVLRAGLVDAVTEVAPGFRDLMLAGKLYETAEWRLHSTKGRGLPRYDLVVADAPPIGQIASFLQAPSAWGDMMRVGRPGRQARSIDAFLRRRARVLLVTTPEELPVAETLDALGALSGVGIPLGPVVVNRVLPPALPGGSVRAFGSLTAERLAGVAGVSGESAAAALEVVRHHRSEELAQRRQLRRLRSFEPVELPALLTGSFGREEIVELSSRAEELLP